MALPVAASAGPPFLTDDPEPTDTGHWEIYAPFFAAEGSGQDFGGALGAEINYGPVEDVQLTLGLSAAYAHDGAGWRWGTGDVEASVKYRFYHDEAAGLQIALFPGISLPTASNGLGAGRVTALLPVWAQQDLGAWSVFGGGGYALNPGAGNRDYWTGGIALTRTFGKRLLVGFEADRQGPDTVGGRASTSLGMGAIYDLPGPLRLLASGGPTLDDGGGRGFHAFAALGIDF
ncbi:MAG: transporter [Croceibacterium sp.]